MKKIFVILLILICSSTAFSSAKEDYEKAKEAQKYRFLLEIREARHRGELRILRAKYDQKVRRRYRFYRYSPRLYSVRACP